MMTIGLELEWADVDRHAEIPSNLGSWNTEDYSIVNSDGHANCPTGRTWRWGGEINTTPTATCDEQRDIVDELRVLLKPTINYKCNLHVHVKPDVDLLQDLELLKSVALSLRRCEEFVYSVVEPIRRPLRSEFTTDDEFRGANKRYRRNLISHHHSLSEERWLELMSASTVQEVKDAHASPTRTGSRAWHIASRPGMNLRSLWKHGTIEFRHFPGTCDGDEAGSAALWCRLLVESAVVSPISALDAERLWRDHGPWKIPQFKPYDHSLALGFERTRFKR
jgi:hypothetical protein